MKLAKIATIALGIAIPLFITSSVVTGQQTTDRTIVLPSLPPPPAPGIPGLGEGSSPALTGGADETMFPTSLEGMFFAGSFMSDIMPEKDNGEWYLLFLNGWYYGLVVGECNGLAFETRHAGKYRYSAGLGLIDVLSGNLWGTQGQTRFALNLDHSFSFRFAVTGIDNPCYGLQGTAVLSPAQLPGFVQSLLAPAPDIAKPDVADPTKPLPTPKDSKPLPDPSRR